MSTKWNIIKYPKFSGRRRSCRLLEGPWMIQITFTLLLLLLLLLLWIMNCFARSSHSLYHSEVTHLWHLHIPRDLVLIIRNHHLLDLVLMALNKHNIQSFLTDYILEIICFSFIWVELFSLDHWPERKLDQTRPPNFRTWEKGTVYKHGELLLCRWLHKPCAWK